MIRQVPALPISSPKPPDGPLPDGVADLVAALLLSAVERESEEKKPKGETAHE